MVCRGQLALLLPSRLPEIRLLDRPSPPAAWWSEAIVLIVAGSVGVLLVAVAWWMMRAAWRERRNPHRAAVMRLSRACRLTAAQRRLIEQAAERSRVDRLAILVAPSAFDRAAALADLPHAEAQQLRARLFGGNRRAA